jgi:hypothetical protein
MRYRDIEPTTSRRFRLPPSHPILAEISIEPADQHRFEQLSEDNPDVEIVGHDAGTGGRVTMFVACSSASVRQRLEDGWA